MKVLVTNPRGFCAGVVRAIDIVELAIKKYGEPVYVEHQIVHNPNVVQDVEHQGAITVEEINEIPDGSVVVFSAHGSAPDDYEQAKSKNLRIIDISNYKINLSIRVMEEQIEKEAMEKYGSKDSGASLGAILGKALGRDKKED